MIVVGVDHSAGARGALRFALEEARLRQATLTKSPPTRTAHRLSVASSRARPPRFSSTNQVTPRFWWSDCAGWAASQASCSARSASNVRITRPAQPRSCTSRSSRAMKLRLKRGQEPVAPSSAHRVSVDRRWSSGGSGCETRSSEWRAVAPRTERRRWCGPERRHSSQPCRMATSTAAVALARTRCRESRSR
jgi:hypothetical protein